jgi:hypothetical protein
MILPEVSLFSIDKQAVGKDQSIGKIYTPVRVVCKPNPTGVILISDSF